MIGSLVRGVGATVGMVSLGIGWLFASPMFLALGAFLVVGAVVASSSATRRKQHDQIVAELRSQKS